MNTKFNMMKTKYNKNMKHSRYFTVSIYIRRVAKVAIINLLSSNNNQQ